MLNLISLIGLGVMILLAWAMSSNRRAVDWRLVFLGIVLQVVFAAIFFNSQHWKFERSFQTFSELIEAVDSGQITETDVPFRRPTKDASPTAEVEDFSQLWSSYKSEEISLDEFQEQYWQAVGGSVKVPRFPRGILFYGIEAFFDVIQESVSAGSSFVFETHAGPDDPTHPKAILTTFAFGVLPTVIFFAALMSVLYYLGFMQRVVRAMAWVMQRTLRTSASESLAAAANVLVGHTEAPLVVRPYIATMTRSELNALMVGGFATISGSLMAIFANLGVSAGHLLTASMISAPAALVIAKILQPETETPTKLEVAEQHLDSDVRNVIEAAARGASEGMKLAINIGAMLIAFLALITFLDICLQSVSGWFGFQLTLSQILGVLFFPVAWIMGIQTSDCLIAGDLLGKKMVVNEFLAYLELAAVPDSAASPSGISERTRVILTYALCGFSNFGAIGIQLGGIGPLAPERRGELAQLGLRAMFGGAIAACMTACIAGVFDGIIG